MVPEGHLSMVQPYIWYKKDTYLWSDHTYGTRTLTYGPTIHMVPEGHTLSGLGRVELLTH